MNAPTEAKAPHRRGVRAVAMAGAAATAASGAVLLAGAAPALAARASSTHGHMSYAWQSTVTHQIHIRGYAFDRLHRNTSVQVGIVVDGRRMRSLKADGRSPNYDRTHDLGGRHVYHAVFDAPAGADRVQVNVHPVGGGSYRTVSNRAVRHRTPVNERILAIARRKVGDNYSYGADGPSTFDCSGFTRYVYRHSGAAHLPHNAEGQRTSNPVRHISRSHLRRGDLVFFMSGGDAYHVSIYAGHGTEYSATNPSQGVEHGKIWSHNVRYGTTWH